ncbi:MAG: hypothetical protein M1837_007399 [Sclerophora amabilis]|nr:MAG: hypothetical protein M1837_007399 [Sclerophora amabilis]
MDSHANSRAQSRSAEDSPAYREFTWSLTPAPTYPPVERTFGGHSTPYPAFPPQSPQPLYTPKTLPNFHPPGTPVPYPVASPYPAAVPLGPPPSRPPPRRRRGSSIDPEGEVDLLNICAQLADQYNPKRHGKFWEAVVAQFNIITRGDYAANSAKKRVEKLVTKRRQQLLAIETGGERTENSNWTIAVDAWIDVLDAAAAKEDKKQETEKKKQDQQKETATARNNLLEVYSRKRRVQSDSEPDSPLENADENADADAETEEKEERGEAEDLPQILNTMEVPFPSRPPSTPTISESSQGSRTRGATTAATQRTPTRRRRPQPAQDDGLAELLRDFLKEEIAHRRNANASAADGVALVNRVNRLEETSENLKETLQTSLQQTRETSSRLETMVSALLNERRGGGSEGRGT